MHDWVSRGTKACLQRLLQIANKHLDGFGAVATTQFVRNSCISSVSKERDLLTCRAGAGAASVTAEKPGSEASASQQGLGDMSEV